MILNIKIVMDNAAFEDVPEIEVCRILSKFLKDIDGGHPNFEPGFDYCLRDINGNKVGFASIYK